MTRTRKDLISQVARRLDAVLPADIHRFGAPDIMNTDQGSQFKSFAGTDRLKRAGIRISMDGKGRCIDNVFIERLWRSPKYECVYCRARFRLWDNRAAPCSFSPGPGWRRLFPDRRW